MAKLSVSAKCNEVKEKGFITVADPAIDIVAVHMAYIQCSLLHIPSVIRHGNSLTNEVWS